MNPVFLIIAFLFLFFFFYTRENLTNAVDIFKKNTLDPILNEINGLINSKDYQKVSEMVPNQILLKANDQGTVSSSLSSGDVSKISKGGDVLEKAKTLNDLFTTLLSTVNDSTGIYNPSQLKAFNYYYMTLQQNNQKVILALT